MKYSKRELIARTLQHSGILRLLEICARKPGLIVLNYHRIGDPQFNQFDDGVYSATAQDFATQLEFLCKHFRVLSMPNLLECATRDFTTTEPCVLITFDDGYADNYQIAFMLLKRYGLPATFFVPTDYIDRPRLPWWDHIAYVVKQTKQSQLVFGRNDQVNIDLQRVLRSDAVRQVLNFYKGPRLLGDAAFLSMLEERAQVKVDPAALGQQLLMSWGDLRIMADAGMAIGSHTHTQQILSRLSETEQLTELTTSKSIIEHRLGHPITTIAYPVGTKNAFTAVTKRLAKEAGYQLGFSFYGGINRPNKVDPFDVKRNGVGFNESLSHVRTRMITVSPFFTPPPHDVGNVEESNRDSKWNSEALQSRIRLKNFHLWLPSYLAQIRSTRFAIPTHVFFCFCDHFEPLWGKVSFDAARARVLNWQVTYPSFANQFHDADGRHPQHTFFFPEEEYRPEFLDSLADLCRQGFGEVEIHLHHDNDTAVGLKAKIETFKTCLQAHGFLSNGRYGFIHGNWALDNSRRDGRWCGVNNELQVLCDTGCYADFTLPSAPSDTQTHKINSIYYATDDPLRPKSHDTGVDVHVGGQPTGDLLLVQGPLALNWRWRKWGMLPRFEHADISGNSPGLPSRIDLWVKQRISVTGKPDWVFVKVHTHGCQERNFDVTMGKKATEMHKYLQHHYNDGNRYILHYLTARETFNLIKAAEAGMAGDPNQYRNYVLPPPPVKGV